MPSQHFWLFIPSARRAGPASTLSKNSTSSSDRSSSRSIESLSPFSPVICVLELADVSKRMLKGITTPPPLQFIMDICNLISDVAESAPIDSPMILKNVFRSPFIDAINGHFLLRNKSIAAFQEKDLGQRLLLFFPVLCCIY